MDRNYDLVRVADIVSRLPKLPDVPRNNTEKIKFSSEMCNILINIVNNIDNGLMAELLEEDAVTQNKFTSLLSNYWTWVYYEFLLQAVPRGFACTFRQLKTKWKNMGAGIRGKMFRQQLQQHHNQLAADHVAAQLAQHHNQLAVDHVAALLAGGGGKYHDTVDDDESAKMDPDSLSKDSDGLGWPPVETSYQPPIKEEPECEAEPTAEDQGNDDGDPLSEDDDGDETPPTMSPGSGPSTPPPPQFGITRASHPLSSSPSRDAVSRLTPADGAGRVPVHTNSNLKALRLQGSGGKTGAHIRSFMLGNGSTAAHHHASSADSPSGPSAAKRRKSSDQTATYHFGSITSDSHDDCGRLRKKLREEQLQLVVIQKDKETAELALVQSRLRFEEMEHKLRLSEQRARMRREEELHEARMKRDETEFREKQRREEEFHQKRLSAYKSRD